MRKSCFAISLFLITSATLAAGVWEFSYRPATTRYVIYGGALSDPVEPSANDKKIAFYVEGKAAKEIFDAIGPDKKDLNVDVGKARVRYKDGQNILCQKSEKGEYSCSFGFDLKTGKSIGGSTC